MAVRWSDRVEFLRDVYANGVDASTRDAYITTWRSNALDILQSGVVLTSSSSAGRGTSSVVDRSWDRRDVMDLAAWARSFTSYPDVGSAIAVVPTPVRSYGRDFRKVGVL